MEYHEYTIEFQDDVNQLFKQYYGTSHWSQLRKKLSQPPRHTTIRCNTLRTNVTQVRHRLCEMLNRKDIQVHAKIPDALVVPSLESEQVVQYDAKLRSVIVDRLCGEAVLRGSNVFARGIICASAGISLEDHVVNVFVDLDRNCTRGFPFDMHTGRKLFIGIGKPEMSRGEMFREVRGLAVQVLGRVTWNAPPLNDILNGEIYMQNLPSIVCGHVLNPIANDVVLDMCAAPGGKTAHLASLMQNSGILVACDRSRKKVVELHKTLASFDITIATCFKLDSSKSVLTKLEQSKLTNANGQSLSVESMLKLAQVKGRDKDGLLQISGFFPNSFDKILLDPPCSALGLRPRLTHETTMQELEQYNKIQKKLLWAAVMLLKPGGILVYSTCTINPLENEKMVHFALTNYKDLSLVPQNKQFMIGSTGLQSTSLSAENASMVQRFDPTDATDTTGFFCAKFQKRQI